MQHQSCFPKTAPIPTDFKYPDSKYSYSKYPEIQRSDMEKTKFQHLNTPLLLHFCHTKQYLTGLFLLLNMSRSSTLVLALGVVPSHKGHLSHSAMKSSKYSLWVAIGPHCVMRDENTNLVASNTHLEQGME